IEARLYAEDPAQHFIPSTGPITHFSVPTGPGIRLDSGIESGDEISQFYDPMIAKLIVYGEDRSAAIERLSQALARITVFGVATNLPLLQAIATSPAYREGQTYTDFLEQHKLLEASATQDEASLNSALQAAALVEVT